MVPDVQEMTDHHKRNNIHEIWPNFGFFVHGGVAFEPYKKGFEKLLGKPIVYIENYLASEGFIAFKNRQHALGMHLILNNNIFMEFVPFDNKNFDLEGNIVENPEVLMVQDVEEDKDYAILLSTNSGAWRYLIGDTVRFIDKERTRSGLWQDQTLPEPGGEHLSVDNMNKAVEQVSQVKYQHTEYTVAGLADGNYFAHQWYVACNDNVPAEVLRNMIDEKLRELNDDYAVERDSALKVVGLQKLPENIFLQFMESKGKVGGQHKFPRVLKGKMYEDWLKYLKTEGLVTV
jgi:hypothetical protein